MANEVVKSFSESLTDKLITVENALPKDFNKERFVQNCLAVLNEKPELKEQFSGFTYYSNTLSFSMNHQT